jgi:hypothetical protein
MAKSRLHKVSRFAIKLVIVCVDVVCLSGAVIHIVNAMDPYHDNKVSKWLYWIFGLLVYLFFYALYVAVVIFIVGLFLKRKPVPGGN